MYVLILLTHQTLCAQNKYEFDYETWMRMRIRNISGFITESMFRWSQRSPQLQLNKSRGQIEWMNESNRMQMRLKCIAEFLARCHGRSRSPFFYLFPSVSLYSLSASLSFTSFSLSLLLFSEVAQFARQIFHVNIHVARPSTLLLLSSPSICPSSFSLVYSFWWL